jgi:hypothetical protein
MLPFTAQFSPLAGYDWKFYSSHAISPLCDDPKWQIVGPTGTKGHLYD